MCGHNIEQVVSTAYSVELTLKSGVVVRLASNRGYVHLNFSGIGVEKPVQVTDQAANQLNVRYPERPESA